MIIVGFTDVRRRRAVRKLKSKGKKTFRAQGRFITKYRAVAKSRRDPQRLFTSEQKFLVWDRQRGLNIKGNVNLDWKDVEFDHIIPWAAGGRTSVENCVALTPEEHKKKSMSERVVYGWMK